MATTQGVKRAPRAVDVAVGKEIRSVRLMRGMSQSALGEKLDITFQQVQKYEKGTNRVGMSRMAQICEALGITVDYFHEAMGTHKTSKSLKLTGLDMLTDPMGVDIAQLWSKLKVNHRKALRQMAHTLVNAGE